MPTTYRIALVLIFVSSTFFLAAFEMRHFGEGAPEWHTVARPQIPAPPLAVTDISLHSSEHPPILVPVNSQVCRSRPVPAWIYDEKNDRWIKQDPRWQTSCQHEQKFVIATWSETQHCYYYTDDYGREKLLPDYAIDPCRVKVFQ